MQYKVQHTRSVRHKNLKKIMDSLGYKFITFTETLQVPYDINNIYNYGYSWRDMQNGCQFPSLAVTFLLKKYYCYPKVLDIAPLTKFLSVDIRFKKKDSFDKGMRYKHIKITYIFATPLVIDNFLKMLDTFTFLFTQCSFSWYLERVQRYYPNFLSLVLPGSGILKISECCAFQFNGKFPPFSIFLNRLRYSAQLEQMPLPLVEFSSFKETPFCDSPSKSTLEGYSNCGIVCDDGFDTNVPFIPYLHLTLPSKFFLLSKFKSFSSFEPSNILCSVVYNYMLLNNIYLSKDKQFIQIVQSHPIRDKLINLLTSVDTGSGVLANVQDFPIYNSILVSGLPISKKVLGTAEWLLNNLIAIVTMVSRVLHMYVHSEDLVLLLVTFVHSVQFSNKLEYLAALPLLSIETLYSLKEYKCYVDDLKSDVRTSGDGMGCGWFDLLTCYILEENPEFLQEYASTSLVSYYLKFPTTRVRETIVSTNLFDTYVYSPCVR